MTISGLIPQHTGTSSGTHLVFSPGWARCADGGEITFDVAVTKRIDHVWSAGEAGGCLDVSGANAAWFSLLFFVIENPTTGAVDILASNSPTNPVLPSGFTRFRRISSAVLDGSSNVIPCIWTADGSVLLKTPMRVMNARPLGDPELVQVVGPTGVRFQPIYFVQLHEAVSADIFYFMFRDPELGPPPRWSDNQTAFIGASFKLKGSPYVEGFTVSGVRTDAMSRVYIGAGPTIKSPQIYTADAQGWVDPRDEVA